MVRVAATVALVGLGVVAVAATAVVAYDLAKGRRKENDTVTPASDASPGWGTKDDPRVKKAGWTKNPNRTGSFGETDAAGKFKEKLRVDSGQPGETGWKGKDHEHHNGSKKHLPVGSSHPDVPQQ